MNTTTAPALRARDISAQWIIDHGACISQLDTYIATFGDDPLAITPALIIRAAEVGLDIDWAARRLLTPPAWAEYDRATRPARDEFDRAVNAAWEEHDRATRAARDEFYSVVAPAAREDHKRELAASAEYRRARLAARDENDHAYDAASDELNHARASALIRIIWGSIPYRVIESSTLTEGRYFLTLSRDGLENPNCDIILLNIDPQTHNQSQRPQAYWQNKIWTYNFSQLHEARLRGNSYVRVELRPC